MAVVEQSNQTKQSDVASIALPEQRRGRNPWTDAWIRLRRNRAALVGIFIILVYVLAAIFAPVVAPKDPNSQTLADNNAVPNWVMKVFPSISSKEDGGYATVNNDYILGADNLGRDLLSRIIFGARVSLSVAFIGPFVALLVGLSFGLISGYWGGGVDNIMMRLVDIMYAFPTILLIILMMAFFRSSFSASQEGSIAFELNKIDSHFGGMLFIFMGIGFTSWMNIARLARGQVLSVREQEYIVAAESIGVSRRSIVFRHILPNILGPIVVVETLTIPTYISLEAFLSFIGLGVNRPTPSWGSMISDGSRAIVTYPNQAIFPALALFFIMFAFNFLGDGLRDALDPHMTQE